jgi:hypothetical protein
MAVREVAVNGSADPNLVWERYADLTRWPTWSPQISRVDAPGLRLAAGLEGRVRVVGGLPVPFVITAVDPVARRWSWRVSVLGIALNLDHGVEVLPRGSRATLRLVGPLPVVAAYAPLTRLALRRLTRP